MRSRQLWIWWRAVSRFMAARQKHLPPVASRGALGQKPHTLTEQGTRQIAAKQRKEFGIRAQSWFDR
jgi:hypothetical protein